MENIQTSIFDFLEPKKPITEAFTNSNLGYWLNEWYGFDYFKAINMSNGDIEYEHRFNKKQFIRCYIRLNHRNEKMICHLYATRGDESWSPFAYTWNNVKYEIDKMIKWVVNE